MGSKDTCQDLDYGIRHEFQLRRWKGAGGTWAGVRVTAMLAGLLSGASCSAKVESVLVRAAELMLSNAWYTSAQFQFISATSFPCVGIPAPMPPFAGIQRVYGTAHPFMVDVKGGSSRTSAVEDGHLHFFEQTFTRTASHLELVHFSPFLAQSLKLFSGTPRKGWWHFRPISGVVG